MNYFEHHIGDYDEATAHLTACEDGIYSRLIRKYMATEKPLPADLKALQRLVRARTREEREAVQTILDEFFELTDDGWRQHRCDETIARYQDKQSKARRSAEARWSAQRLQSDCNANASPIAMRTHSDGNANQTPSTKHQTPNPKPTGSSERSATDPASDSGDAESLSRPAELSIVMRRHSIQASPHDPRVEAAAKRGITPETLEAACAEARAAKPGERIGAAYVLAIAERWAADAARPRQARANGNAESRQAFNDRENARAKEMLFGPEADHAA
ncbi:YdaU family protein [Burkholderia gladioli]|uniref:YdaU family protein n=1 Tax=Burkholderia gladioli TaxID=28095 RepID=UPI000BBCFA6A|nr:YdaU family protein [Burkholderia gladioli]ATF86901.1 hypothetical protein CO712_18880 [Burkholderia gladioli pv. gladioli]